MGFSPTSTLVCTLSLFGFRPEIAAPAEVDNDTTATNSTEAGRDGAAYARALAALDDATLVANTDPEQGIALLNRALEALHQFAPLLALDEPARARRSLAHLALARAKLSRGDERGAAESIEQTLRELGDLELPMERLGPTLGGLVEQRRVGLEALGVGRLRVICTKPCSVWVDERAAESTLAPEGLALILGSHRVWIEDQAGQLEPVRLGVEIDAEKPLELQFPGSNVPRPQLGHAHDESALGRAISPDRKRIAPRWAEALTTGVGIATLAFGTALWAIDSRCPGGVDPRDTQACPQLYDTRRAGMTVVALGSATLVVGVVLLTLDEVRPHPRGREHAKTRFGAGGLRF